jgi:hypothetical protein
VSELATDPLHIVENGICVRTPSITPQSATVVVETRLRNDSVRDTDLELTTELLSPSGETVRQNTTAHSLAAADGFKCLVGETFNWEERCGYTSFH